MMRSFTSAYLTLLSATLILSFLTLINASPSNLESRQSTVPSGSGQIQVLSESGDALMGCLNSAGQFVVDDSECGIFRAMPVNNAVSAFKSSQGLCFFDSTNGSYNYMCDYKSTSNLVGSSFGVGRSRVPPTSNGRKSPCWRKMHAWALSECCLNEHPILSHRCPFLGVQKLTRSFFQ